MVKPVGEDGQNVVIDTEDIVNSKEYAKISE